MRDKNGIHGDYIDGTKLFYGDSVPVMLSVASIKSNELESVIREFSEKYLAEDGGEVSS